MFFHFIAWYEELSPTT